MRRIMWTTDPNEVRRAIAEEPLRKAIVKPPLDDPEPPGTRPVPQSESTPIESEIISRPSSLRGDPTGGKLPWMDAPAEWEGERGQAMEAAKERHEKRKKAKRPGVNWRMHQIKRKGSVGSVEALNEAISEGDLEIGECYSFAEIKAAVGHGLSGGMEMILMRLAAAKSPYRIGEIPGISKLGQKWRIELAVDRSDAAA